jgi:penicillin-binding protein 2
MRTDDNFGSRRRSFVISTVVVAMLALVTYKLITLQFFEFDSFRSQAEQNSIRRIAREPMRGLIYDRDMKVLVGNNPSYTLTVTPFEFRWSALATLQKLFGIDSHLVRYRISQEGQNSFEPVKIMRDMSFDMISILEENRAALPGVSYIVESRREYYNVPRLAHLLGNIKEISPAVLKRLGNYYRPGDVVGANGVEAYYEPVLRGNKGFGFYTVNSHGKVVESFEHGQSDIPASEGADIVLSIDIGLQQYLETLMKHRRGAAVVLDPNNGEVLACTSNPDYDPRELSGRIPFDVWNRLNTDESKPLYNRWAMAAYPPGSTFKMMIAAAALQEGIIDESSTISCPGYYTLAGVTFKCHGAHGNVNVIRAIEYSCNVFFYKLIFKLGFENWSRYGSLFHFGRRTGIDISNESTGVLPSEEYYNKRYGKRWNKGYLVSLGIGQGEVNTTPLQMAAYTATIANGGTYYRPHVVRSVIDRAHGGLRDVPIVSQKLPISSRVWSIIQTGMYRVVNGSGTGYAARVGGISVAGKTGTAQNPHGRDHAWFVAYAPLKNPKIALAMLVENGGYGGDAAAPMAGAIMRYFFYGRSQNASQADSTEVRQDDRSRKPAATSLAD